MIKEYNTQCLQKIFAAMTTVELRQWGTTMATTLVGSPLDILSTVKLPADGRPTTNGGDYAKSTRIKLAIGSFKEHSHNASGESTTSGGQLWATIRD